MGFVSDDAAIAEVAVTFLYMVPISIGFTGMFNTANASFNALGKPLPPLLLSAIRLLVVYIPLSFLAAAAFGYTGVFAAMSLVNTAFGLIGQWWNRQTIHALRHR